MSKGRPHNSIIIGVHLKNSSDLSLGRRPESKSEEFSSCTPLVDQIITILGLKPLKKCYTVREQNPKQVAQTCNHSSRKLHLGCERGCVLDRRVADVAVQDHDAYPSQNRCPDTTVTLGMHNTTPPPVEARARRPLPYPTPSPADRPGGVGECVGIMKDQASRPTDLVNAGS